MKQIVMWRLWLICNDTNSHKSIILNHKSIISQSDWTLWFVGESSQHNRFTLQILEKKEHSTHLVPHSGYQWYTVESDSSISHLYLSITCDTFERQRTQHHVLQFYFVPKLSTSNFFLRKTQYHIQIICIILPVQISHIPMYIIIDDCHNRQICTLSTLAWK